MSLTNLIPFPTEQTAPASLPEFFWELETYLVRNAEAGIDDAEIRSEECYQRLALEHVAEFVRKHAAKFPEGEHLETMLAGFLGYPADR